MSAYVTKPTSACERVSRALSVLLSELHFPTRALGPITEARDLLLRAALDANEFYATERDELVRDVVQLRSDLAAAVARASSLERTIATLWMRLRRAGQFLIEEVGACGPENADDTAERAAGLIRKQADTFDALSSQLGNLLAVIHRDGGHYESEHGTEKACADAELAVHVQRGIADGYHGALKIWRQRAEQAEARLAAIDNAPTVAVVSECAAGLYVHQKLFGAQLAEPSAELIYRPTKDQA